MKPPLLIIDTNYLCHRAFHSTGSLTFKGIRTGVIYGVLREVLSLRNLFETDRIAFCFDSKNLYRKMLYPKYKSNRGQVTNEADAELRSELYDQINKLETEYLERLGIYNSFSQVGYEADDLIASITQSQHSLLQKIIVSADKDLYQLLDVPNTSIYQPRNKKLYQYNDFKKEWGIEPEAWVRCKAFAGDVSDNVPGIPGVGLKTAAKFIRGELKEKSKAHQNILNGMDIFKRNVKLMILPFPDVSKCRLRKNKITPKRWRDFCQSLGMKSMRDALDQI